MAAAANPVNTPPPPPIEAEPAHHDAVCLAVDGGHPRAWVASVDDNCTTWRALSRDKDVLVDFDPHWFKRRYAHAAGKMYWHICNSGRVLVLDPATLRFSYLLAPAELSDRFCTYHVVETPEDSRLRIMAMASRSRQLQLWVRGEARCSDNGWLLEREMVSMRIVWKALPGLLTDLASRIFNVWPSDMDAGRTGKVFIQSFGTAATRCIWTPSRWSALRRRMAGSGGT